MCVDGSASLESDRRPDEVRNSVIYRGNCAPRVPAGTSYWREGARRHEREAEKPERHGSIGASPSHRSREGLEYTLEYGNFLYADLIPIP
jgi:hypothetical protein